MVRGCEPWHYVSTGPDWEDGASAQSSGCDRGEVPAKELGESFSATNPDGLEWTPSIKAELGLEGGFWATTILPTGGWMIFWSDPKQSFLQNQVVPASCPYFNKKPVFCFLYYTGFSPSSRSWIKQITITMFMIAKLQSRWPSNLKHLLKCSLQFLLLTI